MESIRDLTVRKRCLRAAIDSHCRGCSYDSYSPGTWREQVAQCSALDCALWPVRPAPHSGPFANPYRDPAEVPSEWVALPVGRAFSGHPLDKGAVPIGRVGTGDRAPR